MCLFVLVFMFQVIKENVSPYVFDHSQTLTNGTSFTKMAVNGYTFCNMRPGLISMQVRLAVRRLARIASLLPLGCRRRGQLHLFFAPRAAALGVASSCLEGFMSP